MLNFPFPSCNTSLFRFRHKSTRLRFGNITVWLKILTVVVTMPDGDVFRCFTVFPPGFIVNVEVTFCLTLYRSALNSHG